MKQWALRYLKMGYNIIPLKPRGKEPLFPWKEWQTKRVTSEDIAKWWNAAPNANIGIVTGKLSNLAVIDLDGPEGISSAAKLKLTSPVASISGGGKHLWYLNNEAIKNSVKTIPGIDVRAEGGYIVAPPSVHPNGMRYRFINGPRVTGNLPFFPMDLFVAKQIAKVTGSAAKEDSWIAKALEEMKDGNIDNTLTSVLGRMRHDGYTAEDARILLLPHAERVGAADGHLEEKIRNIWSRYEPSKSGLSGVRNYERQSGMESIILHSPDNQISWQQYTRRAEELSSNIRDVLRSGYKKMDEMLVGGLKSSRLFTIAARTGTGKTNWLIGGIRHLCRAGKIVLLFSTEMPYEEIWQRYINTLESDEEFKEHKFYVCDSFSPNIEKVEEAIRQVKPDVFIFDHINHVSEEQHELGAFMQGLNYLRRKYDCAGIVAAQLNRSADWVDLKTGEKVTARMSMIKGSGTIEQASSRVLLLSEKRVTPDCVEIEGVLDKNDNGPKGMIQFGLFSKPYWRMEEL
jgi:hypothetical protein